MSDPILVKPGLIEGIGNEVVLGFGAFLGILISVVAFFINRHRQTVGIHPDSAANVESIRQHLQRISSTRVFNSLSNESQEQRQPRRQNNGQLTCPVCLGDAVYAVETNCGHFYCGLCIITYWRHQNWLGAVPCPSCRTQVTLLLLNFTEAEAAETGDDATSIRDQVHDYNRRFSGEPRPILDYVRDLPTLLRHAYNEFFTVGGLIFMFRVRVVICILAAFIYFVSPLDIIPEAAFGILGFLDDVFVVLLLAIYISIIYRQVIEARANHVENPQPEPET